MSRLAALALLVAGCYVAPATAPPPAAPQTATAAQCVDDDRDGYCADIDCDDRDPNVHPNAPDILADGIDQNCDGYK